MSAGHKTFQLGIEDMLSPEDLGQTIMVEHFEKDVWIKGRYVMRTHVGILASFSEWRGAFTYDADDEPDGSAHDGDLDVTIRLKGGVTFTVAERDKAHITIYRKDGAS